MNIEKLILSNLTFNEEYSRQTLPFIKSEYFQEISDKIIYKLIENYIQKYNAFPSREALVIDLSNESGINEEVYKRAKETITTLIQDKNNDIKWLVDRTEKFCQERALYNAIFESIQIIDDKSGKVGKGIIPQLLSEALAVSFDTAIGHDYFENADARFEYYNQKEFKVPFSLESFNNITKGGVSPETLNIVLAGVHVGKTLTLCQFAASHLLQGKNVLYITLEISEKEISKRIDANLLDLSMDELDMIPKSTFDARIQKLKRRTTGKLIVKQYPTSSANASHFKHLFNELRLKKNFKPDVVYIDYINLCTSSRVKYGSNINSYTYIKNIAEELRGLAVECHVPILTATQVTRSGYTSSDVGMEDTAESFGLPATADFMFALTTSEDLQTLGQLMVKQLKNRYDHIGKRPRFVVGVDYYKMRLYDIEDTAQVSDTPVMDKTTFGEKDQERRRKLFEELS